MRPEGRFIVKRQFAGEGDQWQAFTAAARLPGFKTDIPANSTLARAAPLGPLVPLEERGWGINKAAT
jgi:hypothetical protein